MGSWWVLLNTVTYVATLHVFHVEAVLSLFAFLVLLLLTAAFLNDTEAAGEDEERGHYSDGDERPWRHCRASWEKKNKESFRHQEGHSLKVISQKKDRASYDMKCYKCKHVFNERFTNWIGIACWFWRVTRRKQIALYRIARLHFEGRTIWLEFKSIKHLQHNDALVYWFSWSSETVKHLCRTVRYYVSACSISQRRISLFW